jgi:hypothetical protein
MEQNESKQVVNLIDAENKVLTNLIGVEPGTTISDVEKSTEVVDLELLEPIKTETTFSDVEKSIEVVEEDVINPIRYLTNEQQIKVVKLTDLKRHPLSLNLYGWDGDQVRELATNIRNNSLINRIIINKDNEILSGFLRSEALKNLGITETEAYVKDIPKENELDFIISSNIQRIKTINDMHNEIEAMFKKYSPGQGNKDSKGENTIALISSLTGYSAYKISSIRKVASIAPELLNTIQNGDLTLNAAVKKCDKITKKQTEPETKREPVNESKTEPVLNEGSSIEAKVDSGATTTVEVKSIPKKDEEVKEITCPCCGQAVKKKNEEFYFLKVWAKKISEYVESLKSPNIAA